MKNEHLAPIGQLKHLVFLCLSECSRISPIGVEAHVAPCCLVLETLEMAGCLLAQSGDGLTPLFTLRRLQQLLVTDPKCAHTRELWARSAQDARCSLTLAPPDEEY